MATIVGKKKARPCTVILLSKKTKAVARVLGFRIPRTSLGVSILSRTSVVPTFSDLTRAMAMSFSSCVSQRAVAGRSVSVKKAMMASPMVITPEDAKHSVSPPVSFDLRP